MWVVFFNKSLITILNTNTIVLTFVNIFKTYGAYDYPQQRKKYDVIFTINLLLLVLLE